MKKSSSSALDRFSHHFKPEVRRQGEKGVQSGAIVTGLLSDNRIEGFGRGATAARVVLASESVSSSLFTVSCDCPSAGRGQLCKHIWGVLKITEVQHPDFLEAKEDLENVSKHQLTAKPSKAVSAQLKEKQAQLRQKQYQKIKEFKKKAKVAQKKASRSEFNIRVPDDVEQALAYFAANGFATNDITGDITDDLMGDLSVDFFNVAKKKLSRVFHPDKGGSHEEMLTLNRHFDVIIEWLRSR
jgi:hypothetical protein